MVCKTITNINTMKRVLVLILLFVVLSMNAQNEVVRFMGIPVDGTKAEMISKLEKKGFIYNKKEDWLEGRFNGEEVAVFVHTNNELVDRIMVASSNPVSETDIKIKFNTLVSQFENNDKYMPGEEDQYIGEDVDISYEMSIRNKRFQASFHQTYSKEEIEAIRPYIEDHYDDLVDTFNNSVFLRDEGIVLGDNREENVNGFLMMFSLNYALGNVVWFMISESNRYNQYNINIFYDNLSNRPNGEDL